MCTAVLAVSALLRDYWIAFSTQTLHFPNFNHVNSFHCWFGKVPDFMQFMTPLSLNPNSCSGIGSWAKIVFIRGDIVFTNKFSLVTNRLYRDRWYMFSTHNSAGFHWRRDSVDPGADGPCLEDLWLSFLGKVVWISLADHFCQPLFIEIHLPMQS